ncbi:MAG TPA: sigma factor-like helix-turn-helix DNA-binding protein, partial [Pyrinomonadaceae bacterium]
ESNDFVKNRFQTVSHNQNKQIQPSNSDKRLAESVQALSRLHEKIETHETREIPCSSTDLKELFDFINNFLADLPEIERGVLLERFGGSPIERVLTFEEISRNHQISPEYARQLLSKAIEKLKKQSGKTAGEAIERLIGDCLVAVCPLTPAFLIQITNNTYELFQYPPSFYIRLFGKLNSELPVLPEIKSRNSALSEDAAKLVERIKQYLKNCFLPVSLTEIFNRVMPHNENKEIVERVFFEAIQSPDFVIIESDRKDELLLELKNKN